MNIRIISTVDHNAPLPADKLSALFTIQSRAMDLHSSGVVGGSTAEIDGRKVTVEVFDKKAVSYRGSETMTCFKLDGKRISYSKLCAVLEIY